MWGCVHVSVIADRRGCERSWSWGCRKSWAPFMRAETEPCSSPGAACSLEHWAISLPHPLAGPLKVSHFLLRWSCPPPHKKSFNICRVVCWQLPLNYSRVLCSLPFKCVPSFYFVVSSDLRNWLMCQNNSKHGYFCLLFLMQELAFPSLIWSHCWSMGRSLGRQRGKGQEVHCKVRMCDADGKPVQAMAWPSSEVLPSSLGFPEILPEP